MADSKVLPCVVAHADWSKDPKKRQVCVAVLNENRCYEVKPACEVGHLDSYFKRLKSMSKRKGAILAGFDFPIGLPWAYAKKARIGKFREFLTQAGGKGWECFYEVARTPSEISICRPFYPNARGEKGEHKKQFLMDRLGLQKQELLRCCEQQSKAGALFWTMGAKQVGRAAISGWRCLLAPAIQQRVYDIALWPFDGSLKELIRKHQIVIAETYPAEAYKRIGVSFKGESKTCQRARQGKADALLCRGNSQHIELSEELKKQIRSGFESDDAFDAVAGLFGMLEVVLGNQQAEQMHPPVTTVEGWILGLKYPGETATK